MRGKSTHLKRGGLAGSNTSCSNNGLQEVSRGHSSEEAPVMGVERRTEQSISSSMSRVADKATSAVTNREKVVKSSEAERKERMDTSNLMKQILSDDNLKRAYLQVVRNKGAEGVDGMKYTELGMHLEKNGKTIKEQLRTRKYKPQPVRRVEMPKPDGGTRNLGVPTVIDRFVQQAVLKALDLMNDGSAWIVDIDLEKFFDTVNHDKLMTLIGKTIKDGDVISIVRKFLVSGIMIDDEYQEAVIGTPQGGNLSPLLANIMLNELDKEMERRGLNFVRYADDCAPRRCVQVA